MDTVSPPSLLRALPSHCILDVYINFHCSLFVLLICAVCVQTRRPSFHSITHNKSYSTSKLNASPSPATLVHYGEQSLCKGKTKLRSETRPYTSFFLLLLHLHLRALLFHYTIMKLVLALLVTMISSISTTGLVEDTGYVDCFCQDLDGNGAISQPAIDSTHHCCDLFEGRALNTTACQIKDRHKENNLGIGFSQCCNPSKFDYACSYSLKPKH